VWVCAGWGGGGAHGGKDGKPGGDGGKGGVGGGKRGKPGGDGGKGGKRGVGGQGQHPRTAKAMADSAAMAVDGGVADGGAVIDGAHATEGGHPEVDCSTDPEVLRQFRPRGSYYAHAEPVEVVDGVPRVTDNRLFDMCVRNRARAHTRRVYAQYEALPDFVDVMAQAGLPDHAVVASARKADGARPRQKTQHRMRSDTKEKEHKRLDHRARSAPERRN